MSKRKVATTPVLAGAAAALTVAALVGAGSAMAASGHLTNQHHQAAEPTPAGKHTPSRIALPPVNGQFDYQIGGAYTPARSVSIVDRDRSDPAVAGKYNICYVNGFQTQPEDRSWWIRNYPGLVVRTATRRYVTDPGWPGEMILDTSTAAKRAKIAAIASRSIAGCKAAGYQAIEPDNLDSWTRSKGALTKADNVAMATLLARKAHSLGMAIAQKNTSELSMTGKKIVGFDFAIVEECQVYNECGDYLKVYGNHVIDVEYTDNKVAYYTKACAAQGKRISVILRDRNVAPRGSTAYRYKAC